MEMLTFVSNLFFINRITKAQELEKQHCKFQEWGEMDQEDHEPLLLNEESAGVEIRHRTPRQKVQKLYESNSQLRGYTADVSGINISTSASLQSLQLPTELDHIIAIFVVAFDTKAGTYENFSMPSIPWRNE